MFHVVINQSWIMMGMKVIANVFFYLVLQLFIV